MCDRKETIGERIFKLRNERNLSQEEFGDLFKISQNTVYRLENNLIRDKVDKYYMAICGVLAVNPEWLYNGTGERYSNVKYQADFLEGFVKLTPKYQKLAISLVEELLEFQQDEDEGSPKETNDKKDEG